MSDVLNPAQYEKKNDYNHFLECISIFCSKTIWKIIQYNVIAGIDCKRAMNRIATDLG